MGGAFSAGCRIVGLDGRGVILSVIELSLELFSGGPLPLDSLLSPRLVDHSLLNSGLRSFFNFLGWPILGEVLHHFVVRAVGDVVFLFFSIRNLCGRTKTSSDGENRAKKFGIP